MPEIEATIPNIAANGSTDAERIAALVSKLDDAESEKTRRKKMPVRVRVLRGGPYGKPNEVVELSGAELKSAESSGDVDSTAEAVEYALSLRA